jgi:hypothetical protein
MLTVLINACYKGGLTLYCMQMHRTNAVGGGVLQPGELLRMPRHLGTRLSLLPRIWASRAKGLEQNCKNLLRQIGDAAPLPTFIVGQQLMKHPPN